MNADPLAQLRDIYLPAAPSWWPPAPGWWVLAVVLLLSVVWAARVAWRRWQARAPIRAAELLLQSVFAHGNADSEAVHACNELLKRVLVAALDMQPLGKLSGDDWLRALDSISQTQNFSQGPGRALGTARFAPDQPIARAQLHQAVAGLLKQLQPGNAAQAHAAIRASYEEVAR